MKWETTIFRSLEEARRVAEALGEQPSTILIKDPDIRYFYTKSGICVAQRAGVELVLQKKPRGKRRYSDIPRTYDGPVFRYEDKGRISPWSKCTQKTLEEVEGYYLGLRTNFEIYDSLLIREKAGEVEYEYVLFDDRLRSRLVTPYKK